MPNTDDTGFEIPRDWTFRNTAVATGFDRHVREQLPWYDLASGGVAHLIRHYLPEGGLIYDVGASTGNIGRLITDVIEVRDARLIGIEQSEEMVRQYHGPGEIVQADALEYDFEDCDVVVCFLVLMFMPVWRRSAFLDRVSNRVRRGGAVIVFDKLLAGRGYAGTALARLTLAGKVAAGVPAEEIVAKELSLAGVQRPISDNLFERDPWIKWFQFGEFAGWLLEK